MADENAKSISDSRMFIALTAGACMAAMLAVSVVRADEQTLPPAGEAASQDDPFESVNRVTSGFNRVLRGAVLDPLVDGYQAVTPEPMQESISNIFSNLSEPVTAVSSLLQGDVDNAGTATGRFFVNTTLGLGGTSDRATDMGMMQRQEDLGQAMGANGMGAGPHIVLPILGPSNLRDATGDILTGLASPLPLAAHAAGGGVRYSDSQDDIQAIGTGSVDPYVAEREAYEQNRDYQVTNGAMPEGSFPTFADDTDGTVASTPK